jgi:hypothetical protein
LVHSAPYTSLQLGCALVSANKPPAVLDEKKSADIRTVPKKQTFMSQEYSKDAEVGKLSNDFFKVIIIKREEKFVAKK